VSGLVEPYALEAAFFKRDAAGFGDEDDHDWD
jgi:hypothetical protein